MKSPICIVGAGGLGREVKAMLRAFPEWEVAGFYDDNKPIGFVVDGSPCLGGIEMLISDSSRKDVVLALGDPLVKLNLLERFKGADHVSFPPLVHPSAVLLDPDRTSLGAGCIVAAGCVLTTGISIGNHTLINLNVTIGHDTHIGACSSIMPGVNIAGNVQVGSGVLIGSGVNIINNLAIGDFSKIGAGAVVIRDVKAHVTVVGVPAREKTSR